ncbi:MAG: acyl-CoA/acyl-ACP dehydrogenase [Spirochaetes bacterium]|nr:acyl-CoA/acyl-ACP dehydrogenase [Spirochaetota bacterium]
MKQSLEERIEQLKLRNASQKLNFLGRILVDNREITMWEHDTKMLPRGARKWRRRALQFSREHIRPAALEADRDPHGFDTKPILKKAIKAGFQTLLLPTPLGNASFVDYLKKPSFQVVLAAEEFMTEDGGLGLMLLAHNLGLAPVFLSGHLRTYFRHFIPYYLKARYFGDDSTWAFAITEPEAGSDVEDPVGAASARLVTVAKPAPGGYILNGRKCFISGGAGAAKVTVYAKIEGEDIESWTCFIVERGMKGFSVGRREKKMGQRASDASELIFEDVFVPDRNVVGVKRGGWANNKNVLNYSRPAVGAMALGIGRGAFERCLDFCRKTNLGPKPLIEYQDVQIELADMMLQIWMCRSMVWHSCRLFRSGQGLAAACKVAVSDTANRVCGQAMELMGDHGYIHSYGVEKAWRDSRLNQIYEGTNQLNRLALLEHYWDAEISTSKSTEQILI